MKMMLSIYHSIYLINRVQSGGNQIIITTQKTTRAIKNKINFLCGDLPRFGGNGIPQWVQFLSPASTLPPQCLHTRSFIFYLYGWSVCCESSGTISAHLHGWSVCCESSGTISVHCSKAPSIVQSVLEINKPE